MPDTQQQVEETLDRIRAILGMPNAWRNPSATVDVTPEQARRVLQAVKADVHPVYMGNGSYEHLLNVLRHVGEQFGVTE